jgi:membrane protein implicated in regulation of membrane protease activity
MAIGRSITAWPSRPQPAMRSSPFALPTILKYALLQLPALGLLIAILSWLEYRYALPRWLFWTALGLWLGKDVLLYRFVWRSYAPFNAAEERIVGAGGTARKALAPTGYIEVQGELWRAEVVPGSRPVAKGQKVRVVERRGLTLMVEAAEEESASAG